MSLCDWCRAHEAADDVSMAAHHQHCPEYLAWVMHPDQGVLREYFLILGDFHKLHITRVLGTPARVPVYDPRLRRPPWNENPCAKFVSHGPGDVVVLVAQSDNRDLAQSCGVLNHKNGYIFNTLEGAQERALRTVAHYEATAAQARANVEGPPTVRKYTKKVRAKVLEPGLWEAA